MALATLADVRDACNIIDGDTSKDLWLDRQLDAATAVIEHIVGPLDVAAVTWTTDGGESAALLPERASSITTVTVNGTATTDYTPDLDAGIIYYGTGAAAGRSPFPAGRANVVVSYTVGDEEVAPIAVSACTELVRHWFQNGQQGSRPAFGGAAVETQQVQGLPYAVPHRVKEMLAPLASRKLRGA